LVLLPLTLIETLDHASNVLKMHRTDVIRGLKDIKSDKAGQVIEHGWRDGA